MVLIKQFTFDYQKNESQRVECISEWEFGKSEESKYSAIDFILKASLVAQFVKNPPAMQETPVQFLGWEDPLEKR